MIIKKVNPCQYEELESISRFLSGVDYDSEPSGHFWYEVACYGSGISDLWQTDAMQKIIPDLQSGKARLAICYLREVAFGHDDHVVMQSKIGKDAIVLKDGKQVTEFKEGILPWSIQNPIALVFDEYDAGRPDVMFVIQRVLESEGNFTLLDKNKVLEQHDFFRMFATTNTVGLGDTTGLYHGTQQINQGQMDRWNIVSTLNYLTSHKELEIILAKNKNYNNKEGKETLSNMIKVADLTRKGFMLGDISTVMSPRTVMHWAENTSIFKDKGYAFRVTFLNKCDEIEKKIISEYYQRCFGEELPESSINVQI